MKSKGVTEVVLRLNPHAPDASLITVTVPIAKWFSHPSDNSVDVAITEMGIAPNADHLVWPFAFCANRQTFIDNEVELGDEVFISGLFKHHFGNRRNIPIVRIGNLAAFDDEKISTEVFGDIEGFLIEARSMGGLSGSPVFLNLGVVRHIGGEVKHAASKRPVIYLLGLVHGHFLLEPDVSPEDAITEEINAGIAIVVPMNSIFSVIEAYEKQ